MHPYMMFNAQERKIAYFTLEIGLQPELPIYSGGLGILAGDTVKSFADLQVPAVAVTLLNEKGYFHQEIDEQGNQIEVPVDWNHSDYFTLLPEKMTVTLEGRDILIRAWIYTVQGINGYQIPVIFLDTNIEPNSEYDRGLTTFLYGGDDKYRLMQEAILGLGGIRLLQILDHDNLVTYHMNEGHSALLTLELMNRYQLDLDRVRKMCVFTTHTPVPAGHDVFDVNMAQTVLGDLLIGHDLNHDNIVNEMGKLNMTYLALHHSEYINGVAQRHGEVAQKMFPGYRIDAITNGIHTGTWVSPEMAAIFDQYLPAWRTDPFSLRNAMNIPPDAVWQAHTASKAKLIDFVNRNYGIGMDNDTLTIGFARRATAYKRADLLLADKSRLVDIIQNVGDIQVIYGGKAHPKDESGKALIKKIHEDLQDLEGKIRMVYLKNYDMFLGKLMTAGCDLWLNTPERPMEASGTSGMKAAVNGVLNFSVLDGWWLEGHIKEHTGWSIGSRPGKGEKSVDRMADAEDLYKKLGEKIIPLYYRSRNQWKKMMLCSIAFNGSFFSTHRMVAQYVIEAYYK